MFKIEFAVGQNIQIHARGKQGVTVWESQKTPVTSTIKSFLHNIIKKKKKNHFLDFRVL